MATGIWLEQLQKLIERGAQVVEVLPADDYAPAHLPGAVNLPLRELDEQRAAMLVRSRPVVVYCWDSL
jgi:phage shock protein E